MEKLLDCLRTIRSSEPLVLLNVATMNISLAKSRAVGQLKHLSATAQAQSNQTQMGMSQDQPPNIKLFHRSPKKSAP